MEENHREIQKKVAKIFEKMEQERNTQDEEQKKTLAREMEEDFKKLPPHKKLP